MGRREIGTDGIKQERKGSLSIQGGPCAAIGEKDEGSRGRFLLLAVPRCRGPSMKRKKPRANLASEPFLEGERRVLQRIGTTERKSSGNVLPQEGKVYGRRGACMSTSSTTSAFRKPRERAGERGRSGSKGGVSPLSAVFQGGSPKTEGKVPG